VKDREGNEWVLVPVNATEALMKPFHDVAFDEGSGGSPDYESAWSDLIAAAPQFVAGEVADEMCDSAYISKWRGVPGLIGHEPDDEDRQWSREWLEAWRSELGPTLGLVEIREPNDDECRAIWREAKANEGDGSKICAGRAMFDACRAVLWPKEGL